MEILLDDFLKAVLKEDIGRGDLYSKIENNIQVESYILAKESGILSGICSPIRSQPKKRIPS